MVTINPDEQFPHLKNAPIVEAIIDFRARVEADWKEPEITEALKSLLPDYPKKLSMSGFQQEFTLGPGIAPEAKTIDKGWTGLRCENENGLQIAQFSRDGLIFARLRPYEQWERFAGEALRLWKIFVQVGKPADIQRMGVRFVNRMNLPPTEVPIENYLDPAPRGTKDLEIPLQHFFHQDTFGVTGHPYAIRLIRTIQPEQRPDSQSFGIILDIDVFTTQSFEPEPDTLDRRLREMRWLKNKVFFGSIASKALEAFR